MTRDQLEHAIRAACTISDDHELYIFGSQAILGQYPEPHPELRQSIEVDLSPKNKPEAVDKIDGALGENSLFHQTHGFYVHGVSLEAAALPKGWEERTIEVLENNNVGLCMESHDLAASKLIAFREKDTRFVRRLIVDGLIDVDELINRIEMIDPPNEASKNNALGWAKRMSESI